MIAALYSSSRMVPKLKYSYIVRDFWTQLNVLPAKIMQVHDNNMYTYNFNTLSYFILIATLHAAAIREMAKARPEEQLEHEAALDYLTSCSLLFEKGILSSSTEHG